MNFKKLLASASIAALLVAPSAAFAQSSTEGYGGPNNVVAGIEQGSGGGGGGTEPQQVSAAPSNEPTSTSGNDSAGSLPFTGADLGVLAAAGAMLLALGFGLRRLTHHPSQA